MIRQFRYSTALLTHKIKIKEARFDATCRLRKYVVNEPDFYMLVDKMAEYGPALFTKQYFEGYTIGKLTTFNTFESSAAKCFIIDCAVFKNCDFTNAEITGCGLSSGQFENCNFTGSVFSECHFDSHMFKRCNFTGANVHTYTDGTGANAEFSECIFDNSSIKVTRDSCGGDESYTFKNCSLKNVDMSDCNFSITKVTIDNCNTSGTKFNNCKIYELDSNYLFRCEFLVKGGEIVNNPSMADKGLSWIGQNMNPFI